MLNKTEKGKLIISMQKTANALQKQIARIHKDKTKLITELYTDKEISFESFQLFYNELQEIRNNETV